jgi:hypothetical protein
VNKTGSHLRRRAAVADDNDRNRKGSKEAFLRTFDDKPTHIAVHDDFIDLVVTDLPKYAIRKKTDLDEELVVSNGTVMEEGLKHTETLPGTQLHPVSELKNLLLLVGLDKPIGIEYRNPPSLLICHVNGVLERLDGGLGKVNWAKDLTSHNTISSKTNRPDRPNSG